MKTKDKTSAAPSRQSAPDTPGAVLEGDTIGHVLDFLRREKPPVSGAAIAAHLGITRTAVWKHVVALREMGYVVKSHKRLGYILASAPDAAVPTEVLPLLRTRALGRRYRYLESTGSTNSVLAQLAARGAPEGTVVVAERQETGRGRMARGWFSPPGTGLYVSILFRPEMEIAQATSLPLIVGLAATEALAPYLPGNPPQLKWPNDVHIGGRKAAGILCELGAELDSIHHIIAGIGINVNLTAADLPDELRETATSVRMAAGAAVRRAELLAAFLDCLEKYYFEWTQRGLAPFLPRLRERDALLGRAITVDRAAGAVYGVAEGINPDGSLRLRLPDGSLEPVYSGDAHIRQ